MLVEFTKSRARHTNDNALVEGENAAVIRKFLGYVHIPKNYADLMNAFNYAHLNPYVNYHRPCFFPEIAIDKKGKERKKYLYENMMTPYDKLRGLPDAEQYLKPGTTFKQLEKIAMQFTDNEAARRLKRARYKLFKTIFEQERTRFKAKKQDRGSSYPQGTQGASGKFKPPAPCALVDNCSNFQCLF